MTVQFQPSASLTSLSLTPLIDVVFLLLIFFLVATRFAEEERQLDMPLPDASEAQPLTAEPQELFVNVDQEGQYIVSGQRLSLADLEQVLRQAAANNPMHQSVIVRADKRVPFDFVVQAINLCKKAGIKKYMANTAAD